VTFVFGAGVGVASGRERRPKSRLKNPRRSGAGVASPGAGVAAAFFAAVRRAGGGKVEREVVAPVARSSLDEVSDAWSRRARSCANVGLARREAATMETKIILRMGDKRLTASLCRAAPTQRKHRRARPAGYDC
jgi:hypothetical protein